MDNKFPKIKKSIKDFFDDEDGSITRNKVLMIGGMVLILGMLLGEEVLAAHRSHYTHRTHSSHRSSNSQHGSHYTHSSHYSSHSTHSDHYTHGSHSSHASHVSYSNSQNYGSTDTYSGADWPDLSEVQSIDTPAFDDFTTSVPQEINTLLNEIVTPEIGMESLQIENVEADIQIPPDTPKIHK